MWSSTIDIPNSIVTHLEPAPLPGVSILLQTRMGKVTTLGTEPSGIFKKELHGRVFVGPTGLEGDEHAYHQHGGIDRAIHQYPSQHYADWRSEVPPKPELFQFGGFGENLVGTNLNEENVCMGDLYRIGEEVIVQVSEPRSPCSKLNIRFEWPRALKRIQRTGRVGWNFRVLKTGYIQAGDAMVLLERPHPKWSALNVKRVLQGKSVPLSLIQELTELEGLTALYQDWALRRLQTRIKTYELTENRSITSRVRQMTFRLIDPITIHQAEFEPFSYAQIEFGGLVKFKRSYSFVSGNLNTFSLGVALDDNSRGGSAYLHQCMEIGDTIKMSPGSSPKAVEDEEKCIQEASIAHRIVIIGGIGITAFVSLMTRWEAEGACYEVHYAVRSIEDAAYLDLLPNDKTTVYAKSRNERLQVGDVIPSARNGKYDTKIYCCGPSSLMNACQQQADKFEYPDHLLHFESFGDQILTGSRRGEPFEVVVKDAESGRIENLTVSADDSLLRTLKDAGFDMTYFCEVGGCGACKVTVCSGKLQHNGKGLKDSEKAASGMLTCVDRGLGKIEIELDEL
ncbi:protein yiim [Acrodontium crateriforme]|uniref:Protein yiim n=1 Tax=Acrodontium crateriforme TaxID=150365 RepID=A0AAQ3M2J9_9PEZI|nr:protein yiim [Acrodontium crateriforme]